MGIAALEVQLAQEYEKMFVGQMAELQTLRSKLDEQQEVNSILEGHLTSAKEIQMTMQQLLNRLVQQVQEQYEEVSTLRDQMHSKYAENNSTTLSDCGLSGTVRPMDNGELESMQEYNDTDVDTEQQHQIEEMPMDTMENEELESMQEHTQECFETSSTSDVLDGEQQHQLEELRNPRREANSKQSEGSLLTMQVRLEKIRTPVHERIEKRNTRNVKSLSFQTTDVEKLPKLKSKLKHVGLKTHDCKECDRSFRFKSELFRHSLIHTEKPFMCDVCNRSFNLKSNFSRHLRIHTGEIPFVCDVCKRSFRSKFNMLQHMKIHTGEACYKCELCDTYFSEKRNLSRHLLIHTGKH